MLGVSASPVNKFAAPVVLPAGVKLLRVMVSVLPVRSRSAEALPSFAVNRTLAYDCPANAADTTAASSKENMRDFFIKSYLSSCGHKGPLLVHHFDTSPGNRSCSH